MAWKRHTSFAVIKLLDTWKLDSVTILSYHLPVTITRKEIY